MLRIKEVEEAAKYLLFREFGLLIFYLGTKTCFKLLLLF